MRILAIDTALERCAACIMADASPEPLAQESMDLARGHAEALLPLVERVIARVEGGFESLDRVAVTVGPGSYTGLRVGLSAARRGGAGLRHPGRRRHHPVGPAGAAARGGRRFPRQGYLLAAAIDARHGHVYFQALSQDGGIAVPPSLLPLPKPCVSSGTARRRSPAPRPGARRRRDRLGNRAVVRKGTSPRRSPGWPRSASSPTRPRPLARPLYLRGPDAQPQDHARLARR